MPSFSLILSFFCFIPSLKPPPLQWVPCQVCSQIFHRYKTKRKNQFCLPSSLIGFQHLIWVRNTFFLGITVSDPHKLHSTSYKASQYFSRCGGIFPYSHPKSMLWPRWKECRWILSLVPYISKERWGENSSLSSAVPFSCPVGFGKGKSKALLGSAQWYYERQWTQRPRSEELTKRLKKITLLSNTENSCPNRLWNPDIQIFQTEMVRP